MRAVRLLLIACWAWGCSAPVASPIAADLRTGGPKAERAAPACDQSRITLAGLIDEMADLSCLTHLPRVPYVAHTATSHDPESDRSAPGEPGWFANRDALALDPARATPLLDLRGPGVITRIWSANPTGTLRVFLDDQSQPAIEADFGELMRGSVAPFVPPFAFVAGRGHNLYFPIPFGRSCRITVSGADKLYFHIGYRAYPRGAALETFGSAALEAARAPLVNTALRLAQGDAVGHGELRSFALDTGDPSRLSAQLAAAPGGSVIRQLRLWPRSRDAALLRGTVLRMRFDGQETVRVPLGDFFAVGVAPAEISALPIRAAPDGPLTSRWPMPFEREAYLELESTGLGPLQVLLEVRSEPLRWDDQRLLFHARWQPPHTRPSKPPSDWNIVSITGQGHYVGNVLNVVNRSPSWWGEGDEKIYVDGETFPSHFGTGTEDYFGYAWCSNEPFATSFVGQPLATARRNFGYSSLYRFQVLDRIPFRVSLRFDLEIQHWGPPVDVTYDAVSFWYVRPGAVAALPSVERDAYRIPALGMTSPSDVAEGRYHCGP